MTTTEALDDTSPGCGPDCVYLDGVCRCFEGEAASSPAPRWADEIPLELLSF